MNRSVTIAFALLVAAAPLAAGAQDATNANPNAYNDPAMSFTAPATFKRIPVPAHDPAQFDQPAVMAMYVKNPGTARTVAISLRMDAFGGDVQGWATNEDNQLRSSSDSAFIKRTDTKLPNGMPAIWEDITLGSGFNQLKIYRFLWADGVRGVELSESAQDGVIQEAHAKADLSLVSAVAYPKYRY